MWKAYKRVCKPTAAIVLTGSQPFTSFLVMSNTASFKYAWVWRKSNATGHLNAKRMPMKEHEDILIFGGSYYNPQGLLPFNKKVRRGSNGGNFGKSGTENFQEFTNYPRSILEIATDKIKLHPTQKPVALMEYLIKTYTNEGDTVLDNCMGSGTTGVACVNLNRNFIGIERDANYFQIAAKRIAEAQRIKNPIEPLSFSETRDVLVSDDLPVSLSFFEEAS
jgi:site-specific DNA-methyltransferase (adenine-specific)